MAKKQQVPPLRYASVGMTLHLENETQRSQSGVEGSAVQRACLGNVFNYPSAMRLGLYRGSPT